MNGCRCIEFGPREIISNARFNEMDLNKWFEMEEDMLKLSGFRQTYHPLGVKMLAKYARRGIPGIITIKKRICEESEKHKVIINGKS